MLTIQPVLQLPQTDGIKKPLSVYTPSNSHILFPLTRQQFLISYHEIKLTWPFGVDPFICKPLFVYSGLRMFSGAVASVAKKERCFHRQEELIHVHLHLCKHFYVVVSKQMASQYSLPNISNVKSLVFCYIFLVFALS